MNLAEVIRGRLIREGEASPFDVYRELNYTKKYYSVVRYFHVLKVLDLIEFTREEVNSKKSPIKIRYYRIKEGRDDSPCWSHPWTCYRLVKILKKKPREVEELLWGGRTS